tara:strand:- start:22001 stop:22942 length:942 start_codon:yes stop_codon:yes gene_type:complete
MAGWGGSSNGRGPDRSDSSLSGGSRGGPSNNNGQGGNNNSAGQGPARSNVNLSGGTRSQAPSNNQGGNGNNAPSGNMAMRSSLAELARRDRAAVAALGPDGRNVNVASDVFNDDEEGINSISEALGRFGSWVSDRFGAGAPGGFAKSDAAGGLATAGGFLVGGPWGAGAANLAHKTYAAAPGQRNFIGNVASAIGMGAPGLAGLVGTGVGLVDEYVTDLDELASATTTPSAQTTGQRALAPNGNTQTLQGLYPGGKQAGDNIAPPAKITKTESAKSNGGSSTKPTTAPQRRTFSPLNLRFAALRGVPTIEDLL